MDVRFQCFSSDSSCLSAASSGSLCFSPKPSNPKLFFLDPRSTGYGNRCFQHSMEVQTVLPVSSISSSNSRIQKMKQDQTDTFLLEILIDLPNLFPLHAKLLRLPMFPSQIHPSMKKKFDLVVLSVLGNLLKSDGFLKGCPKCCFPPRDPVQRNITNQHGSHLIAGVLKNRKIRFLAL